MTTISPRATLFAVLFLASVLLFVLLAQSVRPVRPGVYIEPCALVLTRSGQECR